VLEEVGGLVIDLEGCLVIEGIEIEQRIHYPIVLQTRTSRLPGYPRPVRDSYQAIALASGSGRAATREGSGSQR
jgi:hypothetical protein